MKDQTVDVGTSTKHTQHSIVTIFSIWNAMMGTSLLTMPWAIKQAGFVNGIVCLIIMSGLMAYTSYIIITSGRHIAVTVVVSEFTDVIKFYIGQFTETVALLSSVVVSLGVAIVFWILMSSSLYHIVIFIYDSIHDSSNQTLTTSPYDDVVCQNHVDDNSFGLPESFKKVWDETSTVPLFLIILIFPLTNIRSPTFFTKFTALGTVSISYLIIFVAVKAGMWGFHLNFEDSSSPEYTENFKSSFPILTGVAAMALFLHNTFMTIMRHQRHPENNTRDLTISFCLVCATYIFMGTVFYASFPLDKSCINDNLLNNMTSTDIMSFVARVGLFFQILSTQPLVIYVVRTQILQFLFGDIWPSRWHVVTLNTILVAICVLFAVFLPQIGNIISFTGAFCGLSYGIVLPCIVYLVSCHKRKTLTGYKVIVHCLLIAIGVINFVARFVVIGQ